MVCCRNLTSFMMPKITFSSFLYFVALHTPDQLRAIEQNLHFGLTAATTRWSNAHSSPRHPTGQ